MKKIILILFFIIIFSACKSITDQDTIDDNLIEINLDFEDSTHNPWEAQYSLNNFSIGNENNNRFGIFKLFENGDYWTSPNTGIQTARSEIQLFNTCKIDTKITYSFDFKIPNDYIETTDWQIICQFHDQPDSSVGESWSNYPSHSPPISVKYRNTCIIIAVYSWDKDRILDIVSVPIEKNKWNNLKLTVYWSLSSDGSLSAWLNDSVIKTPDDKNIYYGRNCFNKASNYIKIGMYRSNSIMTRGEIHFDNVISKKE